MNDLGGSTSNQDRLRETREHWDARYRESESMWSGKVNHALEQALTRVGMSPGPRPNLRALDLGCGEGGDALWLASQGFAVTGVDISPTAIERAQSHALRQGVTAIFAASDAESWLATQHAASATFDLITASFLHTNVAADREELLRAARNLLHPGGVFLTVSHAHMPPWARPNFTDEEWEARIRALPTLQSEPALLSGEVLLAEVWDRTVEDPSGQPAVLEDLVVAVRCP
ncbi:class I SAM-dependent methyltransferase [uncultured Brevibacterium sp.]|uniref:class I SAM-dependent methyltransferase n=1 Tax=uncultured Brevibacterium sp. TaxID=189678 RepID=UPI0025D4EFF1|nr:class I SAM-dependent methyltransferase [uncultured Brevibacterium sp.]